MDQNPEYTMEETTIGKNYYRNKVKKNKKKFIANAKGFGKMGNFGRGSRLEGDEWSYYINIMDVIRKGHDSLEDKITMADNVFEQTIDKEIYISSNQIACTILENLLPFTNSENFERYQRVFAENFRPLCSNKFASHILQKLIDISFLRGVSQMNFDAEQINTNNTDDAEQLVKKRRLNNETQEHDKLLINEKEYNLTTKFEEHHIQVCQEFVIKMSKFLLNNLEDYVWDLYGSHLIRTSLLSLIGIYVEKTKDFITQNNVLRRKPIIDIHLIKPLIVPENWLAIIKEYAIRLQSWPQFSEFPYNELSSGILQCLCIALRKIDKNLLKHLGSFILNNAFLSETNEEYIDYKDNKDDIKDENMDLNGIDNSTTITTISKPQKIPKVFTNESSIRLLETVLQVAGPKLMTNLYIKLFYNNLKILSDMKSANFTVQKLLDNIKTKEEFESIFDELSKNVEQLLRCGHTGVVYSLATACKRLSLKQGAFMQSLQTALHCNTPVERHTQFALLTMQLKPYEVANNNADNVNKDKTIYIHLHGSLILQTMLQFNKPIKLVQSLLDTDQNDLMDIFCNARGSHIVDAFLKSQWIGEKSREKFIKRFRGSYLQLATSKYGSRAIEIIFDIGNDIEKLQIVKELSKKQNQLNSTPIGRIINYKFHIDMYRQNPQQWKSTIDKSARAEKLFKDILKPTTN